jgi:hypothetical protein
MHAEHADGDGPAALPAAHVDKPVPTDHSRGATGLAVPRGDDQRSQPVATSLLATLIADGNVDGRVRETNVLSVSCRKLVAGRGGG